MEEKNMEKLTLSDGTILENSYAIEIADSNSLIVYANNHYQLGFVFDLLYDSEKTQEIVYTDIQGKRQTFSGYNRLKSITDEGEGRITAVLKK